MPMAHALPETSGQEESAPKPEAVGTTEAVRPTTKEIAKEPSSDQNIYFPVGDSHLSASGLQKLQKHALYLRQNPKRTATLIGYSESFGSRTYTLAIMEQRLATVADQLHELGVEKSRIRRIIFGTKGRQKSCTANVCRQRVEIQFH